MLAKRIVSILIGAPFVIGLIFCPAAAVFKVFVMACLAVAFLEYFRLTGFGPVERRLALLLGLIHIGTLLFSDLSGQGILMELSILILVTFIFYCFRSTETAGTVEGVASRMALLLLGILYIGTLGSFIGLVRDLPHGIFWILLLLGMTWLNDTFAYLAGHRFGRRRLAPRISPGKTIEGFLGGYLGSFCAFLLVSFFLDNPLTLRDGFFLTFLVGTIAPVGDLSESLIKRSFHVKDSGTIIPGHGGMLDRIDALLFAAPVVYGYAKFIYGI